MVMIKICKEYSHKDIGVDTVGKTNVIIKC